MDFYSSRRAATPGHGETVKASSCGPCPSKPSAGVSCGTAGFSCGCGAKPGPRPNCAVPGGTQGFGISNTAPSGSFHAVASCRCPDICTDTMPGHLENHYQIAMAYVPWQQWQKLYSAEEGFCKGTIFPDLYLPFQPRGCRIC